MLQEAQRTSAPSAFSVSISTAVWIVMCSDPAMRAPLSGCRAANSLRIAISAGISDSAIAISLRPQSASARSATLKSVNFESIFISGLQNAKAPAPFPMRAPLYLAEPDPLIYPRLPSSTFERGDATLLSGRIIPCSIARIPCILAPMPASLFASVVFLKIQDFARRPATEQARLRAQLQAVVAVTAAEIPPVGRVMLDAADGAAVVVLDDPRAALRLAERSLSAVAVGLPLSAGLNHGALELAGRKGGEGMTGDGIAVAAAVAALAGAARVLASRSFRDAVAE